MVTEAPYDNIVLVFDARFLQRIATDLRHPIADAAYLAAAPSPLPTRPDKALALRREIERLLAPNPVPSRSGLVRRPSAANMRAPAVSIPELCALIGKSRRTLECVFREAAALICPQNTSTRTN